MILAKIQIQMIMILAFITLIIMIALPVLLLKKIRKNKSYKVQLMEEHNALLREQNKLLKSKE